MKEGGKIFLSSLSPIKGENYNEHYSSMVKELRDKTGAGMMDAKKALVETDGDMEKQWKFFAKKVLHLLIKNGKNCCRRFGSCFYSS